MKNRYFIEMTDTFGGEANYCWVNRLKIQSTLNPEPRLARLEVWPDLHNERAGYWRLFWAVPGESTMVTAIGYCSPGGTYRTIKEAIADGLAKFGETAVRGKL